MTQAAQPLRPPCHRPDLWIGPAGWSYADWKGRVYPPSTPSSFDSLQWIARFFDLVEVNASFYHIPPARLAEKWVTRLEEDPRFRFSVKLHRSFTHDSPGIDPARSRRFLDFLEPLRTAGRLGPILAQFPWSFRPTREHRDHLARLAELFFPLTLVVELRHGAWAPDRSGIDWNQLGIHPVSIDQPQVGDSIGPVLQADDRVQYLRLHGRNEASWFDRNAGRDQRYDYRYRVDELRPWVEALKSQKGKSRETYVITNNHFQGKAVVNALQMRALLGEEVPHFPRWLEEEFPELRSELRTAGATDPQPLSPSDTTTPSDPGAQEHEAKRSRKEKADGQAELFE